MYFFSVCVFHFDIFNNVTKTSMANHDLLPVCYTSFLSMLLHLSSDSYIIHCRKSLQNFLESRRIPPETAGKKWKQIKINRLCIEFISESTENIYITRAIVCV